MPSPFPGMDPWLEDADIVRDLAFSFSVRLSGAINAVLPQGYFSKTVRYRWFENSRRTPEGPDTVLHDQMSADQPAELPVNRHLLESYTLGVEVYRTRHPKHKRLTVLEVVSPAAKTGEGPERVLFEQRQRRHLWRNKNRIEIDLWRAGKPLVPVPEGLLLQTIGRDGPSVAVIRADRRAVVSVEPIRYDRPLPSIRVPIDNVAGEVTVPLQPIFNECYNGGAYDRRVRYGRPPETPLTPPQQAWADAILREQKLVP